MRTDLVQIRELARRKEDENISFRRFLKSECNLEQHDIDQRVFQTTRGVWAAIDCASCANCCRELQPSFSEEEVDRVARRLGVERQEFVEKYLKRSEAGSENPWQTNAAPCPFLEGNLCSIYEDRPAECSGYPYLYEPDFVGRTLGMIERAPTCPIVYEVIEDLKKSLGFIQRSRRDRKGANRRPRTNLKRQQ